MSETVFTFPGKMGDALHQWPIAFHWARENQTTFTAWMDEATCAPLKELFEAQPCCEKVEWKKGVENYNCGGQPWHFDLATKEYAGKEVFHLGLRGFPQRQLTLECREASKVPLTVHPDIVAETPSLVISTAEPQNRLLLHGQAICPHTRATPQFWRFLYSIGWELNELFQGEVYWIGSPRDREVGVRTYQHLGWKEYDDHGSMLELADFMAQSRLVIAVGSSNVALAGLLKVPAIRVHDPIGTAAKVIWSNLGRNQINETEAGLRTEWPRFRDQWLAPASI